MPPPMLGDFPVFCRRPRSEFLGLDGRATTGRGPAGWCCPGKLWGSTSVSPPAQTWLRRSPAPGAAKEAEGLHLSGAEMSPRALQGPSWAGVHKEQDSKQALGLPLVMVKVFILGKELPRAARSS